LDTVVGYAFTVEVIGNIKASRIVTGILVIDELHLSEGHISLLEVQRYHYIPRQQVVVRECGIQREPLTLLVQGEQARGCLVEPLGLAIQEGLQPLGQGADLGQP
jgi:hypothetical protein